eukprot:762510-Hanusia_phi.AAC.6
MRLNRARPDHQKPPENLAERSSDPSQLFRVFTQCHPESSQHDHTGRPGPGGTLSSSQSPTVTELTRSGARGGSDRTRDSESRDFSYLLTTSHVVTIAAGSRRGNFTLKWRGSQFPGHADKGKGGRGA